MSLDKSLRSKGALARHRNVLSRAERVEVLQDEEKWEDGTGVFGLPKVVHRKVQTRKEAKAAADAGATAEAEGAADAEGTPPEAGAKD